MALRRGSGVPQCNIVTRMPFATIALLCKQTTDNFRNPPTTRTAYRSIYRVTGHYLFSLLGGGGGGGALTDIVPASLSTPRSEYAITSSTKILVPIRPATCRASFGSTPIMSERGRKMYEKMPCNIKSTNNSCTIYVLQVNLRLFNEIN